jgi:hypothetical protein
MTRINNDLRDSLHMKIMKDLPSRDFVVEIHALVQEVIMVHAPKAVQELYANVATREYVAQNYVEVRQGNCSVPMYRKGRSEYFYGLKDRMTIRMDDAEHSQRLPEGSLYKALVTKLHESGLVSGYFQQEELRENVSKRLRANLKAATTIKSLYAILEPELHHFIPKDDAKAQVPACVAPVVDDLRKLGAVLPEVPKAEVKA